VETEQAKAQSEETLPTPSYSFSELTAILDLKWEWAVSQTRDIDGLPGIKATERVMRETEKGPRKVTQYDTVAGANFLIAKKLSPLLSQRSIRFFLNKYVQVRPDPGLSRLRQGTFLVLEQKEGRRTAILWFAREQMAEFAELIRMFANTKLAIVNLDPIFDEFIDRIECWEKGVDYKRKDIAVKTDHFTFAVCGDPPEELKKGMAKKGHTK
jgi:hypothetical protein